MRGKQNQVERYRSAAVKICGHYICPEKISLLFSSGLFVNCEIDRINKVRYCIHEDLRKKGISPAIFEFLRKKGGFNALICLYM